MSYYNGIVSILIEFTPGFVCYGHIPQGSAAFQGKLGERHYAMRHCEYTSQLPIPVSFCADLFGRCKSFIYILDNIVNMLYSN